MDWQTNSPMDQGSRSYGVEVSGWDGSQNFFVEQTVLDWGSNGIKEVSLGATLREGCMVFVRLLRPTPEIDNYPIACKAVRVNGSNGDGRTIVRLEQLRPRAFFRDTARDMNYSGIKVA